MLYICYTISQGSLCEFKDGCNHCTPHKHSQSCFFSLVTNGYGTHASSCSCISLDLKYYMKEVLMKNENDMST